MITKISDWDCAKHVSLHYFCKGKCTKKCISEKIAKVMRDHPSHFVYVGITHDPCYRYTGNPSQMSLLESHGIRVSTDPEGLLLERAHKYDFEEMFVICYCTDEAEIREWEGVAISDAHENDIMMKWVSNTNPGGNGKLKPNQDYYFLYICISKTKPTFGRK